MCERERDAESAGRGGCFSEAKRLISSRFGQNGGKIQTTPSRPSFKEKSEDNCQSSPSSEVCQRVQTSAVLADACRHLLRALEQGLVQPFVLTLRQHRPIVRLQLGASIAWNTSQTPPWRRPNSRGGRQKNADEARGEYRHQTMSLSNRIRRSRDLHCSQ